MNTLGILFWVGIGIYAIALFISLATGNYGTAIWISLCIFQLTINRRQAKYILWQSKLLGKWRELTLRQKDLAYRAVADARGANSTAFYLAMLLGIDNEITE